MLALKCIFYQANHHAFLANAKAIDSFRKYVPDGKIGPSFAYSPAYSASSKPEDMLAFENAEEFTNYWWLDVYCRGQYPEIPMRYLEEQGLAPNMEDGDLELLRKGKPDFVGVNYYQTFTYNFNPLDGVAEGRMNTTGQKGSNQSTGVPGLYKTTSNPHLQTSNWDWAIDPIGLRIGLRRITDCPCSLRRTVWVNSISWRRMVRSMTITGLLILSLILNSACRRSMTG